MINFFDWYTDTVDIYRIQATQSGALTEHSRELISAGVPCRIYRTSTKDLQTSQTAAKVEQGSKLMADNGADICAGDELIIHRGAGVGIAQEEIKALAGEPVHYYEPFGAVIPGLAHQEISLLQEERI